MQETNYSDEFMQQAYQGAGNLGEQQDPNSLYADYMREEKIRNVIEQINPDLLLEDIEHRIRGEKKNRLTQQWELISRERTTSEILISNYISFLGSVLNQNTSLSNFSSGEINNIMSMVVDYIRDDLSDNAELYGFLQYDKYNNEIIDFNEMTRIGNIICMSTFAVLKRAQNGMEARRLFSALKVTENLSDKPQGKGFPDIFKFWK